MQSTRTPSLPTRLLALTLLLLACTPLALHGQRRRRIAVMVFEVGAEAKQKTQQAGIKDDIGRDLADLLIQRLVSDGKFIVIERAALDKIVKEQNMSNSDRFDSSTAAKLGKIAGVDAIVIGSITQFSAEQTTSKYRSVFRSVPHVPGGGMDENTSKATVATTVRLIDTNTAEILASVTGAGDAVKTQKTLVTANSSNGLGYDSKSKDFGSTLIGEATMKAITSAAVQLESAPALSADIPAAAPTPYSGMVADVNGSEIILNIGGKAGVRVGDTVEISKAEGRVIKDPATGATVKVIRQHLGEAKVTEVDADSATATYAGSPVKVKDLATSKP